MVCSTRRFVLNLALCNFGAFCAFVLFALVLFCLFPLPLRVWDRLRLVIVALPGFFFTFLVKKNCG